ncbi:MAG: hypothetical protein K1X89_26375 [Myxococcaceae bacterium]|nr:hypothetical protein [Myxococcaceae bacterium]
MNRVRHEAPQHLAEAPAPLDDPGRGPGAGELAALAARVRAADPEGRGPLLETLVARLRTPAGSPAAHAAALVALLDGPALEGLDDGGVPLRVAAVRALLSLGYPHALQVAPEDLELLRLHDLPAPRSLFRFPAGAAALGAAAWFSFTARDGSGPMGWLLERDLPLGLAALTVPSVALVGFGALLCATADALGPTQRAGRWVLGAAGVALAMLGTFASFWQTTGTAGAVLGSLGALGVLAALLPRRRAP